MVRKVTHILVEDQVVQTGKGFANLYGARRMAYQRIIEANRDSKAIVEYFTEQTRLLQDEMRDVGIKDDDIDVFEAKRSLDVLAEPYIAEKNNLDFLERVKKNKES